MDESENQKGLIKRSHIVALAIGTKRSDEEDGCLWNVDDLLERVRAGVSNDRVYCGMGFNGGDPAQAEALDAFSPALAASTPSSP